MHASIFETNMFQITDCVKFAKLSTVKFCAAVVQSVQSFPQFFSQSSNSASSRAIFLHPKCYKSYSSCPVPVNTATELDEPGSGNVFSKHGV